MIGHRIAVRLGALACVVLPWISTVQAQSTDSSLSVVNSISGTCQYRGAGAVKWVDLGKQQRVGEGDSLLTGPDSTMVLALGQVCRIEMGSITKMTITKATGLQEATSSPAELHVQLESGEFFLVAVKPQGRDLNLEVSSSTARVLVSDTASFVFSDRETGEAVLKMGEGTAMAGNVRFPDRIAEVKSFSVCTVKSDSPEGSMRSLSVAERSELDRLEPLKKAISPAWLASRRREEGKKEIRMPQGHYAMMLARAMDLERSILGNTNYPQVMHLGIPRDISALGGLEGTANIDDYIEVLEDLGVEPLDGWNKDALLTKGAMAVVLVRAYGIEGEIPDERRGDELAYMELLSDVGIVIEGSPDELVDSIIVVNAMTDPILVPVLGKSFFRPASPTLAITTLR